MNEAAYEGYLVSDLPAAKNHGIEPGTAELHVFAVIDGLWWPTNERIVVTNRDDQFSAPAKSYLSTRPLNGENRPVPMLAVEDLLIRGTLEGPLNSGGCVMLAITEWTGAEWVHTGERIPIYEAWGVASSLGSKTVVGALWHAQSARYIPITSPGGTT